MVSSSVQLGINYDDFPKVFLEEELKNNQEHSKTFGNENLSIRIKHLISSCFESLTESIKNLARRILHLSPVAGIPNEQDTGQLNASELMPDSKLRALIDEVGYKTPKAISLTEEQLAVCQSLLDEVDSPPFMKNRAF